MTAELEAMARRFLEETQNARNLDVVDELVSPSFVGHSEVITGIDALKAAIQENLDAFPDLAVTVDKQISSDDTVVSLYSARGTGAMPGGIHIGTVARAGLDAPIASATSTTTETGSADARAKATSGRAATTNREHADGGLVRSVRSDPKALHDPPSMLSARRWLGTPSPRAWGALAS